MDPDHRAMNTTEKNERRSPVVLRCRACGRVALAGRVCSACGASLEESGIAPVGEVLAVTTVERVPEDVVFTPPYTIALVRLSEGAETFAVADPAGKLGIGDGVTLEQERAVRAGEVTAFVRVRRQDPPAEASAP